MTAGGCELAGVWCFLRLLGGRGGVIQYSTYGCTSCRDTECGQVHQGLVSVLFVAHPAAARHGNDVCDSATADCWDSKGVGVTPLLSRAEILATFTRGAGQAMDWRARKVAISWSIQYYGIVNKALHWELAAAATRLPVHARRA